MVRSREVGKPPAPIFYETPGMGIFDWLSNLLGGAPNPPKRSGGGSGSRAVEPPRPLSSSSPSPPPPPPRGPERLEGLDAEQFAPLELDDARQQAKAMGSSIWSSAWLDRRDRIPPADDARTLLIDRMMVTEGLATPEELSEIHRVGAEMDRLRPDLSVASRMADSAVEQSREERERRKAEKKADAERRRQERAEQIAHRRATDIVFLGRGVSRGLADRESDESRLARFSLPGMSTPADVADALGLTISQLRWLAYHTEAAQRTHYVQFAIRKKSGGVRTLASPHRLLRQAQSSVLHDVLARVPVHDAAHGFVATRSTVSNAQPHVGQDVVVNVDLKDFFPSITFHRVEGVFRSLGYSGAVATVLGLLVTECPRQEVRYAGQTLWVATGPRCLPQGACTSPAISNAIAWRLDRRLSAIAERIGWSYTRYADDLTFSASGDPAEQVGYVLARLRHIARDEGFELNPSKTRVQRQSARQSVTGVVVNDRVGVPRKTLRRLRAILHNAQRTGLAAQNRDNHPNFEAWLQGMIAYVRMVNPEQGAKLVDAYEKLRV